MHRVGVRLRLDRIARPRVALALLVLALAVFAFAGTAQANTIAAKNFRVQPKGTVGTGVPVIVSGSGTFDGYPLDPASCVLTVDGAVVPRSAYVATFASGRNLYLYWVPAPALPDGLRTVSVSVADTAGKTSSVSWGFTVAQKPSGTFTAPDAATPNYDGRPEIVAALSDNTPAGLSLAGQVHAGGALDAVAATFGGEDLAAGAHAFALPGELAPGAYTLTATLTDAAGLSAALPPRSFTVVAAEPMTVFTADCLACHEAAGHVTTGITCAECHLSVYHNYADCGDCHDPHAGPVTVSSSCRSCHDSASAPKHTRASTDAIHTSSCGQCHTESLLDRHAMTPEGSVFAYQCALCHESADPAVIAAVESGDTSCDACHALSGHHELHNTTLAPSCASSECHATDNLESVHINEGTALVCASCHKSEDGQVVGAIEANDKSCGACHDVGHATYGSVAHSHFDSYSASRAYRASAYWPTLASSDTGLCRNCHTGSGVATRGAGNEACTACHDAADVDRTGYGYPGKDVYALSSHGADPATVWNTRTAADYAKGTHSLTAYSASGGYLSLATNQNLALGKPVSVSHPSAYGTPVSAYTDGNLANGGLFRGWIELNGLGFPYGTGWVSFTVDLGEMSNVTGLSLHSGRRFGCPAEVLYGYAGSYSGSTGTYGILANDLSLNFTPQKTRYATLYAQAYWYFYDPDTDICVDEVEVYGDAIKGTWTSPVIDISSPQPATGASLAWTQSTLVTPPMQDLDWDDIPEYQPPGQSALVETRVSFDGGTAWTEWQALGHSAGWQVVQIPQLPSGTDVANARLQYRVTLDKGTTSATGPWVKDFSASVSHQARNAASTYPGTAATPGSCTNCHDPHGTPGSIGTRAASNDLCYACHDAAGVTPAADWRYKGAAAYQASAHSSQACGVCHAVHGAADGAVLQPALLNQPRTSTCTTCHPSVAEKVAASTNSLAHHSFDPAEQAAGSTALECGDCHQPHSVTAANPLTDAATGATYSGTMYDPQSQTTVSAVADTYVMQGYPDMVVGSETSALVAGSPANPWNALLHFDASQYPASSAIRKATLRLKTSRTDARQGTVRVFPMTSDWNENSATWNLRAAGVAWTAPGGDFSTAASGAATADPNAGYLDIDVTEVVKWQLANGDHGMILTPAEGSSCFLQFSTREQSKFDKAMIVFDLVGTQPVTDDITYCMTCHSGATPPAGVKLGTTKAITSWTTGPHGLGAGAWRDSMYDSPSELVEPYYYGYPALRCTTCHDPHGSSNAYHLRDTINGKTVTGIAADGTGVREWCSACHTMPGHGSTPDWQDCFGCHQHGVGF